VSIPDAKVKEAPPAVSLVICFLNGNALRETIYRMTLSASQKIVISIFSNM
jgi:hypothetical protein